MFAYLLDIVILLAAAVVAVPFFRLVGLGAVPGFLVAGVLVGPSGLALIDNVTEISRLSELGVVLLLFVIGIELKPSRLWLMRRLVFGLGSLQVVVTGALLTAAVYLLMDVSFRAAVVIGPALALSSTAFVLQLLSEQRLLHSEYGRASLAVLLLQDLAVVPLLALVPLLAIPELTIGADIALALAESVAILLLVVVFGRFLLQPILHRVTHARTREVFTALTVLLVLGSALLTEHIGLSMAMGAFIAGLLIADSPFRHEVIAEIEPFRGLLSGPVLHFDGHVAQRRRVSPAAAPDAWPACRPHRHQVRLAMAIGRDCSAWKPGLRPPSRCYSRKAANSAWCSLPTPSRPR